MSLNATGEAESEEPVPLQSEQLRRLFAIKHFVPVLVRIEPGNVLLVRHIVRCYNRNRYTPLAVAFRRRGWPVSRLPRPDKQGLGVALGYVSRSGAARLLNRGLSLYYFPPAGFSMSPVQSTAAAPAAGAVLDRRWGAQALGVDSLHAAGHRGRGITIGVVDSGLSPQCHPSLADVPLGGFADFVHDPNPEKAKARRPHDHDSIGRHGSEVCSFIAGQAVANYTWGIAPEAQLVVAAVVARGEIPGTTISRTTCDSYRLIEAIDWVVQRGARIVNLSLRSGQWKRIEGLPGEIFDYDVDQQVSAVFQLLITELKKRNVLVVAASGNSGVPEFPGCLRDCLSVGAHGPSRTPWVRSGAGTWCGRVVPDFTAPGCSFPALSADREVEGTSFAAAHVSGLAAALWSQDPTDPVDSLILKIRKLC